MEKYREIECDLVVMQREFAFCQFLFKIYYIIWRPYLNDVFHNKIDLISVSTHDKAFKKSSVIYLHIISPAVPTAAFANASAIRRPMKIWKVGAKCVPTPIHKTNNPPISKVKRRPNLQLQNQQ